MSSDKPTRGDKRRREVLDAALACFLEKGVETTTLEEIRTRSGASVGSIYHLFAGKDAIAGELFLDCLRDLHSSLLEASSGAKTAEEGVHAVVEHYLAWIVEHPDRARFMFRAPRARIAPVLGETLVEENRQFLRIMRDQVAARAKSGEVRAMPMDVFVAVVMGPMQEYARQYLAGTAKTAPKTAARELAICAWNAVRSR